MYLHPPWELIPQVLKKIQQEKLKQAVLINPLWPSQFCFPMIMKTILLLCIATMWHLRFDIDRLQYCDITLKQEGMTSNIRSYVRTPKKGQVKSITLGSIDGEELCPDKTTYKFVTKTVIMKQNLPEGHTLFITYIDSYIRAPTSVKPTAVANWIKLTMELVGIDTKEYQAHFVRAAANTEAVELGHSIQDVKKHAN